LFCSVDLLNADSLDILFSSINKINDLPLFFSSVPLPPTTPSFGPRHSFNLNNFAQEVSSSSASLLKPSLGNTSDLEISVFLEESLGPENFLILTFDNSQNKLMRQSVDDFIFCYILVKESELHTFSDNAGILEQSTQTPLNVVQRAYQAQKFSSKNLVNCWLEEPHTIVLTNFGQSLNKESTVNFRINGLHFSKFMRNLKSIKIENRVKLSFPLFHPSSWYQQKLLSYSKEQGFSMANLDSSNTVDYHFNSLDDPAASLKHQLKPFKDSRVTSGFVPISLSHQTSLIDSDSVYSETIGFPVLDQPSLDSPEPLRVIDLFFEQRLSLAESDAFILFSSPRRLSSTSVFSIKAPSLFQEISLTQTRTCSLMSFWPSNQLFSIVAGLRPFFSVFPSLVFQSSPSSSSPSFDSYSRLHSENITFQVFNALTNLYQPSKKTLFLAQNPSLSSFLTNNAIDLSVLNMKIHDLSDCLKNGDTLKFYFKRKASEQKDFLEKNTMALLMIPAMPTDKDTPKLSMTISNLNEDSVLLQSSLSVSSLSTWTVPMFQNPLLLNTFLDPFLLSYQFFKNFDISSTSFANLSSATNASLDLENSISSSETIFHVYRGIYNNLQARLSASNISNHTITHSSSASLHSLWHLYSPDKVEYFLLEDYNGIFSLDQGLAINSLGLSHLSLSLGVARTASPSLYYLKFTHKETLFPGTLQKLPLIRLQVNKAKFNLLYHMDSNTSSGASSLSEYPIFPLYPDTSSLSLMFRTEHPLFEDSEFIVFLIDAGNCIYLDNNEENRFFLSSQIPSKILNLKTESNCDRFNPKLLLLEIPPNEQKKFMNDAINQANPSLNLTSFDALSANLLSDPDLVRSLLQIYADPSNSYVLFKAVYLEFQVNNTPFLGSPFYEVNVREVGQHVLRFDIATNFVADIFYYCAPTDFNISLSLEQIKANIQSLDNSNSRRLSNSEMFKLSLLPSPPGLKSMSIRFPTLAMLSPNLSLLTELSASLSQSSSTGIKSSSFGSKQFEKNIIYDAISVSSFTQVYTVRLFPLKASTSYSLNLFLRNPQNSSPISHAIRFSTLSSSPQIIQLSFAINRRLNWKTVSSLLCKLCTFLRIPAHLLWTRNGINCDLGSMWTIHSLHFAYLDSLDTTSQNSSDPPPDLELLVYDSLSSLENKALSEFLLSRASDPNLLSEVADSIGDSTLLSSIVSVSPFTPVSLGSLTAFTLDSSSISLTSPTSVSLSNVECHSSVTLSEVHILLVSSHLSSSLLDSLFESVSSTPTVSLSPGFELQQLTLKPGKSSFFLNVYNFHHATFFSETCTSLKSEQFSIPILNSTHSQNESDYIFLFMINDDIQNMKVLSYVYTIKVSPTVTTTVDNNQNSQHLLFSYMIYFTFWMLLG
jgi:hypothetical protein